VKPLCIDLYCGLGGWAEGFLSEGWDVIGFDIERHCCPGTRPATKDDPCWWDAMRRWQDDREAGIRQPKPKPVVRIMQKYPAQLVLQDVLTLHGRQFRDVAAIVASPPCQAYSWMAMPWSLAKREASWQRWERDSPFGNFRLNDLFNACFRLQREASEAAGRHIPMCVENVKGAQPWVGRAQANFGSFYLWGDVRSVGGRVVAVAPKFGQGLRAARRGGKVERPGQTMSAGFNNWPKDDSGAYVMPDGSKVGGGRFGSYAEQKAAGTISPGRLHGHRSAARKAASAMIAKIPFDLARHIAECFRQLPGKRRQPTGSADQVPKRVHAQGQEQ
jgi:hypothetical protein